MAEKNQSYGEISNLIIRKRKKTNFAPYINICSRQTLVA